MIDVINIILGAIGAVTVSATVSLFRKWLESLQFQRKISCKIKGKMIEFDVSKVDELKQFYSLFEKPQIFIAYAFNDKEIADYLAINLRKRGLRVWLADEQIKPGDSISSKIEEGLTTSGYMIALLSNSSINSKWVQEEFKAALSREIEGKWPRVIPVLIESIEVPSYLSDKLYVDLRNNYELGINKIIETIMPHSEQQA
ncbi:MAG: toll/interleukin-1 receptor domain-containing protein [Syntrophobacterales bacterium]|jgi:hypothetical protein|nr:toll/interleukin-1 receptor domain-containing protein [Syntrophobacterales bacterium]